MKIGFIGMGNMASAIAVGLMRSKFIDGKDVFVHSRTYERIQPLIEEYNFNFEKSNSDVAAQSDIIIIGVKPDVMEKVAAELQKTKTADEKVIVSIAAGWSFENLKTLFPQTRCLSIIPNVSVKVNAGVSIIEQQTDLENDELSFVTEMFEKLGMVKMLPAEQIGISTAISGCGPAFAFMFIEALGDAGVQNGLSREDAYALAAQMLLGSAEQFLETKEHPGKLKDSVCSPGGLTIQGVAALEEEGFRNAVIKAVSACQEVKKE
ncbi:pyrroline-5-carboxylate reductase [Methanimicrococcus sp. OttesenSCG-928-J09]|nr:pyrroline-5-carboxylate reductase [Methanimicrococcus sp. OttesenSCG-928-J09]